MPDGHLPRRVSLPMTHVRIFVLAKQRTVRVYDALLCNMLSSASYLHLDAHLHVA